MEAQIIPTPFYKHHLGVDQASSFTDMPDGAALDAMNMEAEESGLLSSRAGCAPFLSSRLSASVTKIFDYQKENGNQYILAWNGTRVDDITSGTPSAILTGISNGGRVPGVTVSNDTLIWVDGLNPNKKFDGTNVWNLSVPAAGAFPTLDTSNAGSITLAVGQKYVITFYNSTTGEEGNPYSPLDLSGAPNTGAITSKRVDVTRPSVPGSDPQVSHWRIYKTDDGGAVFKRHAEVAIGTSTYQDNVTVPAFTIELELDNDEAPTADDCEEFEGSVFLINSSNKTQIRYSKPGNNSAYPPENEVFASRRDNDIILGIRNKNNLLWIKKKYSTWVLNAHPSTGAVPIKVADRGTVHKFAFDGSDQELYSIASNGHIYKYYPTEFLQAEVRYLHRSTKVQKIIRDLNKQNLGLCRCVNYSSRTKNQIFFAVPYGAGAAANNRVLVYDTNLAKQSPQDECWWPFRFMFDITSMDLARVSGEDAVLFGDSSGNVFKYPSDDGDGAQENGTSTGSNTNTTLNDTHQAWTTDEFKGLYVTIVGGTGVGQERKISSNAATQLTIGSAWVTNPDISSQYTIGGYLKEYQTNWKNFGLEAMRKVMRYIRCVLRQGGNYPVKVIFRRDFETGGIEKEINLAGSGSFWGVAIWGLFLWGAATVVRDRIKFPGKFNSCQIIFRNNIAGQNFSIEGFTTHHQEAYLGTKR